MTTILILIGVFAAFALLLSDLGWNNVLSPDRNELVFEGRNRAYGAYPQRREHHRVMILAFGLAMGSVAALLFVPKLLSLGGDGAPPIPPRPEESVITIEIPSETPKQTVQPRTTPPIRNNDQFTPVAVDTMPAAPIDTSNVSTDPILQGSGTGTPVDTGNTQGAGGGGNLKPEPPKILTWVPQMPVFPGGDAALERFWQNNVNWTSDMIDGEKAVVYVEFVVDVNGRVYDARIAHSVGARLDAAVMRAMQRMPDWDPGRMGDEPVRVRLTQPVRFKVK